ncbi:MAG: glutamine amidotransferase class-I [Caulobacteraceae bacterium]|nr:glutamine amidotransferase class-I [Caulobacteraceae bacterium]
MRIAILETGRPPRDLIEPYGRYDAMFRRLLGEGFAYETFPVHERVFPGDPDGWDGMLVTGSASGVYDERPWIAPLEDYLLGAAGKTRMVGVCFGHQVMAQAFGGTVIKSPKGRGIGLHRYRLAGHPIGALTTVAAPADHGDQVVELAPRTRVLGGNEFTPYGILEYPFQAISVQFHPEFEPPFAKALLERERAMVGDEKIEAAKASLDQPNDNDKLAAWMGDFLRG